MKTKLLGSSVLASFLMLSALPAFAQECDAILKGTRNSRITLYSSPNTSKPSRSYGLGEDQVELLTVQGSWAKIRFPKSGVVAWIPMSSLNPLCD
jgi:hypothetical protein